MKSSTKTAAVLAALMLTASIGITPAAVASSDPAPDGLSPAELRSQYTDEELFYSPEITHQSAVGTGESETNLTMRGSAWVIECNVAANAPHISSGAGGVIYKTRVNCTGVGDHPPQAYLHIKTALFHIPADSPTDTDNVNWIQYYGAQEGRWFAVNGATQTVYAPVEDYPGFQGKGFWQGTSIIDIIEPEGFQSGNDTSPVWFLDTTA